MTTSKPSASPAPAPAAAATAAAASQEPSPSPPPEGSASPVEGSAPPVAGEAADPEERQGGKCPICVMFEEGGCKQAFDAFMDCGVDAEKGSKDYQECVVLFDAMRECMQRNPAVFAALLQDVDASTGAAGGGGGATGDATAPQGSGGSTDTAAAP